MTEWRIIQTDRAISAGIDRIWIHRYCYNAHLTIRRNGTWKVTDSFLIRKKAGKNHEGTPAAYRKLHTKIANQIIEWAEKDRQKGSGAKQKESTNEDHKNSSH